jgi:hypothetical protein
MKATIRQLGSRRSWPAFLGLLACLLALPSLKAGLLGDGYLHRAVLLRRGELAPLLHPVTDLFAFVKQGEPAELMRRLGYLPWWSDPGLRIALLLFAAGLSCGEATLGALGYLVAWQLTMEPGRPWKRSVLALLVLHGPIGAALLVARTATLPAFGGFFTAAARHAPTGPEIGRQTFVYVNGNDFPVVYGRIVRIADDEPAPRRTAQLAAMTDANRIYRADGRTLVITPDDGFLSHPLDRLLASGDRRFRPGDRIDRPDYEAKVLAVTPDGRPASVAFRFRGALEDSSLRWLYWKDRRLQAFPLPAIGHGIVVPAVDISPF